MMFFLEVVISGMMAGVLYALVALGFVLIFKASGVFNYSQGVMALLAGLFCAGFIGEFNIPVPVSIVLTCIVMIGLAVLVEYFILRHLVNQEGIILFMATIGLAYVLEGGGDLLWGAGGHRMDIGLPDGGNEYLNDGFGLYVDNLEMVAAAVAAFIVAILTLFSQYTKVGRGLRAVADDHQAALSVGISLRQVWITVWAIAGIVALVAGIMWGSKSGSIQFSLSLIALKALPVLILGGFTSIPGAIIGGLMIGVGEKIAEIYLGPIIGGAIEDWFAYVLALGFLLFRPQGLFGDRIIERV